MLNQKYKVKHKIGEGSFATVYSVTLNKPNKVVIRAMKVVLAY